MVFSKDISDRNTVDIDSYLSAGHSVSFAPIGSSMYPLFVPEYRDRAIIVPLKEFAGNAAACDETSNYEELPSLTGLKRGDVVLYRREDGMLVLHRIYRVRRQKPEGTRVFFMVGDHQSELEGPLPGSFLRGVMTGFTRKGRSHSVRNPGYIILSRVWLLMRPLRLPLISFLHRLKMLFRRT